MSLIQLRYYNKFICVATHSERLNGQPWLLLIHQIPPKPDYFRVKVGRRLARVGAVAIKNSVYVLPETEQGMEDFQWILREIVEGGGEASICRSTFVDGLSDAEIERFFREARSRDYEEISADARATLKALPSGRTLTPEQEEWAEDAVSKFKKRLAAVARIDFFRTKNRDGASETLGKIEARLRPLTAEAAAQRRSRDGDRPRGRTWVTRQGIFVDRIASAWLIRRFLDRESRFKFIAPQEQRGYSPKSAELRFDMFEAEYTHQGDRCTFETLLRRFDIDDRALAEIAEIVHDIDLKDGKFGREDAVGIERVLAGIAAACPDDSARLERGARLFDELYLLLQKERAPTTLQVK
jgi:hypothetical protein